MAGYRVDFYFAMQSSWRWRMEDEARWLELRLLSATRVTALESERELQEHAMCGGRLASRNSEFGALGQN
jgi:hypothetical protein